MDDFKYFRNQRLRNTVSIRDIVAETRISINDFIYPIFVTHGYDKVIPIEPMPGISQLSIDRLTAEIEVLVELGISSVLLFGIPEQKDSLGSGAYKQNGIVQEATRIIKKNLPDVVVITDVCLCEYTDHGHCGLVDNDLIDNDRSLKALSDTALSQADAGSDMIAPSAMMDGQVNYIRDRLDNSGHKNTPIMAYSAKYASGFYGPFRVAANSSPGWGDRNSYQMDFRNGKEALREIEQDILEGADIVMVKPSLAYLDVINRAKEVFDVPLAAYNVSGEYSMVKAASQSNWLDEKRVTLEILTAIKRAGADMIITYHAKEVAQWLRSDND